MASDINRVILIGRLTRDPELRYIQSGTAVANFSIANNRTYVTSGEKKEQASFFNCIAWAKLGEVITEAEIFQPAAKNRVTVLPVIYEATGERKLLNIDLTKSANGSNLNLAIFQMVERTVEY